MSDHTDKSPYEVPIDERSRVCDYKHGCKPFYIREWETMIVATLIVGLLVYMACCCRRDPESAMYENFQEKSKPRAAAAPSTFVTVPRTPISSNFTAPKPAVYAHGPPTQGAVLPGARRQSQGPAVSHFVDFARIDSIDKTKNGEPNPTYRPETSDGDLEHVLRGAL